MTSNPHPVPDRAESSPAALSSSAITHPAPLSWRETWAAYQADRARLCSMLAQQPGAPMGVSIFHPSLLCVLLYRVAHHLFRGGHHLGARLFWQLNFLATGADISPACEFGPGLVIAVPAGVALMGRAGRNLTVMPCSGIGGEMGSFKDVGAGPGLPYLGDDVVLDPHSGVLGPIRVGNRVRIGSHIAVIHDVPDDSVAEGPRPRFFKQRGAE